MNCTNKTTARTDLAFEFVTKSETCDEFSIEKGTVKGVNISKITLTPDGATRLGKPPGTYTTLFLEDGFGDNTHALTSVLLDIFPPGRALVVGLGNGEITHDSLGVCAVSQVLVTAHLEHLEDFHELKMRPVFAIETGVLAQTGIESSDQLKYITEGTRPDFIVVIDSLACGEPEKLMKTIQISDSGIAPGSGVKNNRKEISPAVLGVPVIAIGVPTVCDAHYPDLAEDLMIVPRDIDARVKSLAKTIASAINHALCPELSDEEIEQLRY